MILHPSKLRVIQLIRSLFLGRARSKVKENGRKWWPVSGFTNESRVFSLFLLSFFLFFFFAPDREGSSLTGPTTFPRTWQKCPSVARKLCTRERKWRRPRCLCGYRFSETIERNSEIVFHRRRIPRRSGTALNFYPRP